jgi:GT2 family glycosyltransferase
MSVLASVVSWNTASRTLACVRALQASRPRAPRVLVVDNGSRDGSVARLRAECPDAEVLANTDNRGFAAAHVQALARAREDGASALWLVNSDAQVEPTALAALEAAWQAHGDALYAGVPLRRDGTRTVLDFPAKFLPEDARPQAWRRDRPLDFDAAWSHALPCRVGALPGSVLFVPLTVAARHGFLDEDYFLYCEEIDYCYRLRTAGVARYLVPAARAWHESGGSSVGRANVAAVVQYYRARNEVRLARRFAGEATATAIALKKLVRAATSLPAPRRAACIARGAWDGWRGVAGRTLLPDAAL